MTCIFCQIVEGKAPCHKVWEDEHHLAFLSIFPNTDGFTVVIPKKHYPSYAFDMPPQALADLMMATKKWLRNWIRLSRMSVVRGCSSKVSA
jgi:diadenosine tetraphosphate (Ap4A) HIT family hydrolase